jgi:xanthine dehydrogenase accessory factor
MTDSQTRGLRGGVGRKEPLDLVADLRARREPFVLATVIETQGSVSAKTASKAVIGNGGKILAGWVGGGCAESAVCQAALDCLASGETTVIDLDLNDEVLGTGMPCGGSMRVYVEPVIPEPALWVLGHGRVAESLCAIGSNIGLDVIVDDPMADPEHYPSANQILTEDLDYGQLKPRPGDFVVVATQHKGDHESLQRVLRSNGAYLGLVASKKRSRLVLDYLKGQGFGKRDLARIHAPAGLDLGARTPEEIALSVLSEIVQLRRGGTRLAMRDKAPEHVAEDVAD